MKIVAFILSVYILVLTAIPCIDEPQDDNTFHKVELTQKAKDHQKDSDLCSPFWPCNCCFPPVISPVYTMPFNCFSFSQKHYSEYQSIYLSALYTSIWQPPKLI